MTRVFADYMVFVDESGSPGMGNIDPHYPLFVLAFFIVKKSDYTTQIAPALQQFKFQHFGHDQVILHERDIRKDLGDFAFLKTPALKDAFLGEPDHADRGSAFRPGVRGDRQDASQGAVQDAGRPLPPVLGFWPGARVRFAGPAGRMAQRACQARRRNSQSGRARGGGKARQERRRRP